MVRAPWTWKALLMAAALGGPALAGCMTGPGASGAEGEARARGLDRYLSPNASWAEEALGYGEGHDHAQAEHHRDLTTPNFEILGWDPLLSDHFGTTAYGHLCGDAQATQDGRRLAAVETRSDVAFVLIDVTDPLEPQRLGELVMRRTYIYDLAVVPDGRHVVLITSQTRDPDEPGEPLVEPTGPDLVWRSSCAPGGEVPVRGMASEDPVPRPLSLLLVDIGDPAQPVIVDQRPILGVGHSVYSTILDGRTWVLASTWASNSGASNYQFYEVLPTPAGRSVLHHLSTYTIEPTRGLDEMTRTLGHNDAWITRHPGTGQTLAWLAHWNHGLIILDMGDATMPVRLGEWTDWDPAKPPGDTGQTHSAFPLEELWDGRHYTVIGPEHASRPPSTPTGIIYVLDTTDPRDPFPVAGWTFPHDVEWTGRLMFSLHYLSVVNHTAFVSAYHGGVWALDLTPIAEGAVAGGGFLLLDAVGVFLPTYESPEPPRAPFRWAPTLQEVHAFGDGTLVTWDSNSGVYTFRFHADRPMLPPIPWPLEPPRGVR